MDSKKCSKCKKSQSKDLFNKNKRSKDGLQDRCKSCTRASFQATINNRRAIVNEFKSGKACKDCSKIYPVYVMDFDHVSFNKVNNVSTMIYDLSFTISQIIEEVSKCEIVCANCHRERTWKRSTGIISLDM